MRVKSRNPPALYLMTSDFSDVLEVVGGADDGVGDEVRQMARDREHEIVVLRIHDLDARAEALPEPCERLDRRRLRAGKRRENAPAPVEEFGEARRWARLLGARDRMTGDEMNARRNVRTDVAHDRALHRTRVRHDGAGFENGRDRPRDVAHRADRHTQDHDVGVLRRRRRIVVKAVADLQRRRDRAAFGRTQIARDMPRDPAAPRRMRDGRTDQADAQNGDPRDGERVGGVHDAMKSLSAAATRRFASSVPTVSRSEFGNP